MHDIQLQKNALGRLIFTDTEGKRHEGVVPVHAFPISAPAEGVALVSAGGQELAWIDNLNDLSGTTRQLVEEELASREFIPEIKQLLQVSTFATPSIWSVETDRGHTNFILKGEDDIRRLNHNSLLIADNNSIHFLIRDIHQLNKHSRKLLDRFL